MPTRDSGGTVLSHSVIEVLTALVTSTVAAALLQLLHKKFTIYEKGNEETRISEKECLFVNVLPMLLKRLISFGNSCLFIYCFCYAALAKTQVFLSL